MSPDQPRYRRRSGWKHAGRSEQSPIHGSHFRHPGQGTAASGAGFGSRAVGRAEERGITPESLREFVFSSGTRRALEEFDHVLVEWISDTYRETTKNYSRWLISVLQRRLRKTEEERARLEQDNEDLRRTLLATEQLQPRDMRAEFERLAEQWHDETGHMSSAISFTQHPAYLRIIAMGPAVVPLILKDLQRTRAHWFVALRLITGENPITPEDRGNVQRLADAWIAWGRQRGLV